MKIIFKTLTPLWTGDIDRKCSKIKETGIMGSLRWWFEATIRGLNYYACDPTDSNNRCPKEDNETKRYCRVCLIFGATGIRRLFRLEVNGGDKVFIGSDNINIKPYGRRRGWFLRNGVIGKITLTIHSLNKYFNKSLILVPLAIAVNWGAIGAKTQHGFGVVVEKDGLLANLDIVKFENYLDNISSLYESFSEEIKPRNENINNNGFPDIRNMFFAKVQFETNNPEWWKHVDGIRRRTQDNYRGYENDTRMIQWVNSGSVPIVPAIKNWLRYGEGKKIWITENNTLDNRIENFIFGTTKKVCKYCYSNVSSIDRNNRNRFWCSNCRKSLERGNIFERLSSKINISCAYKKEENLWEFRIWGWIPENSILTNSHRESFLNKLKEALEGSGSISIPWNRLLGKETRNHRLVVWREFNSQRDTVSPNERDIKNYLESLLRKEGDA